MAADYEKAGKQVCIVNYGEKGWANTQELFELIQELKHADRKPDAVLFYDGGTEAFTAYENKKVDVHSNYLDFKNYLEGWITEKKSGFSYLSRSNTYHLLENIAAKVSAKVAPKRDKSDTVNESEAETGAVPSGRIIGKTWTSSTSWPSSTGSVRSLPGIPIWMLATSS